MQKVMFLTISSMTNNQRIVTDSTGRTYTITYNGNKEHSRLPVLKILPQIVWLLMHITEIFSWYLQQAYLAEQKHMSMIKKENFAKSQTVMMKSQIKFLIWNMGK